MLSFGFVNCVFKNACSSLPMYTLAKKGGIFVPIAVRNYLILQQLKSGILLFSSNLTVKYCY